MAWKKSPIKISNEDKLKIVLFHNSHKNSSENDRKNHPQIALTPSLEEINQSENVLKMISKSLFDDDNDHIGEDNIDIDHHRQELSDDEWIGIEGIDEDVTLHSPEVDPPPYLPKSKEEMNIDRLMSTIPQNHITSPELSQFQNFLSSIEDSFPGESHQFPISRMRNDVFAAYLKKKVTLPLDILELTLRSTNNSSRKVFSEQNHSSILISNDQESAREGHVENQSSTIDLNMKHMRCMYLKSTGWKEVSPERLRDQLNGNL